MKKNNPLKEQQPQHSDISKIDHPEKYYWTSKFGRTIYQFDLKKQKQIQKIDTTHQGSIYQIIMTPDKKLLFSADTKGYLKIWNTKKGTLIRDFGLCKL